MEMSQCNRVQAIKSKFESLTETNNVPNPQLYKHIEKRHVHQNSTGKEKCQFTVDNGPQNSKETPELNITANDSYLHKISSVNESKKLSLIRQSSDPGKKLQRSHAFRCDRSQKIMNTPKRHSSCNGRDNWESPTKTEKPKLSKDRLKRLGNVLEVRMRMENFVPNSESENTPQHILDLYAKVVKNKQKIPKEILENKKDGMSDSGVSSENENLDETMEKGRICKLKAQFETAVPSNIINQPDLYEKLVENGSNLESMEGIKHERTQPDLYEELVENGSNLESMEVNDLCASSETMRLERKNPNLKLTDTLKKALKQPLPNGPPPQKPPRIFAIPEEKKSTLKMLEKLEIALQKQDAKKTRKPEKSKKEIHYLCTEILDITKRSLTLDQNCLNLNCSNINRASMSLPYTRLSVERSKVCDCRCENEENVPNLAENVCKNCHLNLQKNDKFQCHLRCKCVLKNSEFYIEKPEHIYDVPFCGDIDGNTEEIVQINGSETVQSDSKVKNILRKLENCEYGTLNFKSDIDNSFDGVTSGENVQEEKIYDTPHTSRPSSPLKEDSKIAFENLRKTFETTHDRKLEPVLEKPVILHPKPVKIGFRASSLNDFKIRSSSVGNLESGKTKKNVDRSFAHKRENPGRLSLTLTKKDKLQQDLDKENLNRLMNEIYETVSAACMMAEPERPPPSKFPTDMADGSGEDQVKLTRSLTEKRKNYVRRVSSRAGYLEPSRRRFRHQTSVVSYKSDVLQENPYSTFRSWKSFKCSQGNLSKPTTDDMDAGSKVNLTNSQGDLLSMRDDFADCDNLDNLSLDDKAGCLNLDLPFEPRINGLFDLCLLVGFNHMTGQAYVKSVFPEQVPVPPHIENLVFPETLDAEEKSGYDLDASRTQNYSLVLTNEKGERSFGYCRRVLPEGANSCLPLCYCIIGRYRAAGFYYKVLQEIESHHGSADIDNHKILQQLHDSDFPCAGAEIILNLPQRNLTKNTLFRNSINLGDVLKCKTLPDLKKSPEKSAIPDFYDLENNNKTIVSLEVSRRIKRPLEPRVDEDNLSIILESLGAGLLLKVFGSLLLERKVVLVSDNLSQLSSCIEALQSLLYPFVWQQPLISVIPSELKKDILEAPLPILAGMLKKTNSTADWERNMEGLVFEEGMLIDLSNSATKVIFYQSDESTILPAVSYKTLKTSLQLDSSRTTQKTAEDEKTRNVLIAEAFLRFFVDILRDFWEYFSIGKLKDGDLGKNDVVFDKESFKSAQSKQNQYFLEWFTETAMFSHFIQNMAVGFPTRQQMAPQRVDYSTLDGVVDIPLPDFYQIFDERLKSRKDSKKGDKNGDKNYKSVVNKKVRLLKSKLMDLVN